MRRYLINGSQRIDLNRGIETGDVCVIELDADDARYLGADGKLVSNVLTIGTDFGAVKGWPAIMYESLYVANERDEVHIENADNGSVCLVWKASEIE